MLSPAEQQKVLDDFYFNDVLPKLHPHLRELALDSRVLYHTEDKQTLTSIVGKIAAVYWTNPWKLQDIFPVTPQQCEIIAQGMALLYLQYLVIDNLTDGQTPDHRLIPLLSHTYSLEAMRQFSRLFNHDVDDRFWKSYYQGLDNFFHGLVVEYDSVVAHHTPFSPELMRIVDAGIAFTFRIECTALGILSDRRDYIEPISEVFELLTLADQFGDDAIDWQDDYKARHASLPIVWLSEAEKLSYEAIFALAEDEMEDLLNKHQILHRMVDYALQALHDAKAKLPPDCHGTWLDQFLDERIRDEHARKRNFTSIALIRSLSKILDNTHLS